MFILFQFHSLYYHQLVQIIGMRCVLLIVPLYLRNKIRDRKYELRSCLVGWHDFKGIVVSRIVLIKHDLVVGLRTVMKQINIAKMIYGKLT